MSAHVVATTTFFQKRTEGFARFDLALYQNRRSFWVELKHTYQKQEVVIPMRMEIIDKFLEFLYNAIPHATF